MDKFYILSARIESEIAQIDVLFAFFTIAKRKCNEMEQR